MKLYRLKRDPDPGHWIGEDKAGALMTWPARRAGWLARTAYRGARRDLDEVDPMLARGSGWPGARGGRMPRSGAASSPHTIRIAPAERAAWLRAAGETKLSDWIRNTCNAAAATSAPAEPRIGRSRRSP